MSRNIENHDSVLLLQDCIAGCKMALESMDDIREHTDDKQLRELIDKYYDEHTGLSVDCRDMLDKAGADIKEPGMFAKMAAKLPILSDLEFLSDLIALSPDMHLLSFLNQLIAELRMCNGDDSLAFLPGCKTL